MALETGDYINDLVITNPAGEDNRRQGDDHMRLIKKTLTQSFPNIDAPVTATPADLNKTSDPTTYFPSGGIIMWAGLIANIPTGWALCNGTGTAGGIAIPDLRSRFIIGAQADVGETYNVNDTGGSANIVGYTDDHILLESELPSHSHTSAMGANGSGFYGATSSGQSSFNRAGLDLIKTTDAYKSGNTGGGSGHQHAIGSAGGMDGKNIPPYYALAYIIKL